MVSWRKHIIHGANADMCPFCRDGTSAWLRLGRGFFSKVGCDGSVRCGSVSGTGWSIGEGLEGRSSCDNGSDSDAGKKKTKSRQRTRMTRLRGSLPFDCVVEVPLPGKLANWAVRGGHNASC